MSGKFSDAKIFFKIVKIIAIQSIILIVLLEIASFVIVHLHQDVSWQGQKKYFEKFTENFSFQSEWNLKYEPHPFFGYVLDDQTGNNFGFYSKYNFPVEKQDNEIVIGIFGGSVAANLGSFLEENPAVYKKYLNSLNSNWVDKKIKFVNLAVGGDRHLPMKSLSNVVLSAAYFSSQDWDNNYCGYGKPFGAALDFIYSFISRPKDFAIGSV